MSVARRRAKRLALASYWCVVFWLATVGPQSTGVHALVEYDVESREGTHWPSEQKIQDASQLADAGKHVEAIAALQDAMKVLPKHAQAAFLIGVSAAQLQSLPAHESYAALAEKSYLAAIELGKNSARFYNFATVAHSNVGSLYLNAGNPKTAAKHYMEAIKRKKPLIPDPYTGLGQAYERMGRAADARKAFRKSLTVAPSPALQLHTAVVMPFVYRSHAEIAEVSRQLVSDIDRLHAASDGAAAIRIANPLKELFNVPHYYLAYHGLNYASTIRKLAQVVQQTNDALTYTAPWVRALHERLGVLGSASSGSARGGRIRVGFASMFFKTHSVGKFVQGTIANLDRARFEVHVFALRETWTPAELPGDPIQARIRKRADKWYDMPKAASIVELRQPIEGAKLDVLVFPEIGMDPGSLLLAMTRLAPVQMVMHGHALTTGIGELDYFVSYRPFEARDAQSTYTERLVSLPSFIFYHPPVAPPIDSAAALWARVGVPFRAGTRVYTCPQLLVKLSPDFDAMLKGVLVADPRGVVLLKTYASVFLDEILAKRLDETFADAPDARARVVIAAALSEADWFALLTHADVVLDSYPFGGFTTTLEAFSVGTPVVTLPHPELMYGRCTAGLLRIIGLDELVAADRDAFVAIAVRLANDRVFHAEVRAKIARRKSKIFELSQSVREFETLLEEVVARRVPTSLHDPNAARGIQMGVYSFAAPIPAVSTSNSAPSSPESPSEL